MKIFRMPRINWAGYLIMVGVTMIAVAVAVSGLAEIFAWVFDIQALKSVLILSIVMGSRSWALA